VMLRQDPDDSAAEARRRQYGNRRQRPKRRRREACKSGEAGGISFCRPSHRHGCFVARHLPLDEQLPIHPPDAWVPPGHHAHTQLHGVREIIAALDVRPFVDDDTVQFFVLEIVEKRRRDRDHG